MCPITGCLGGQSGDEGLGYEPGPRREMIPTEADPQDDATGFAAGCSGEGPGGEHGTCFSQDGGFSCDCGERSGSSQAETCQDALRERCDLSPTQSACADEDAGACD